MTKEESLKKKTNVRRAVLINPVTPDSAKSKIDKISKIANWGKLKNKQHHSKALLNSFLSNEWSHFRVLSIELGYLKDSNASAHSVNPLRPGVKLQILLLCFHTFLTEVVGRSC